MRSKPLHFFLLISICGIAGCIGGGKNKFKISGSIASMPAQQVLLEELEPNNDIVTIDSANSDANGHFELSGSNSELNLYRLHFPGNKFILIAADKGNIKVSANWSSLENYKIEGSDASVNLKSFITAVRSHLSDFNTMSVIMDTLRKRGNDSVTKEASRNFENMRVNFTRYVETYADTTRYLPNALFAAKLLTPSVEQAYLSTFSQNLERRFPNSKLAKDFVVFYNQNAAMRKKAMAQAAAANAPTVGAMAPDIKLPNTDGNELALSSFKGKYVLLDFWASWCAPCRAENPNVVAAYNKYKGKNFTVFSVSLDSKKDSWLKAISEDKLEWPNHVTDLKGWESAPVRLYNIESIPSNFLLDPTGKIIARDLRGEQLEQSLSAILK